jgi:hypothetical protein
MSSIILARVLVDMDALLFLESWSVQWQLLACPCWLQLWFGAEERWDGMSGLWAERKDQTELWLAKSGWITFHCHTLSLSSPSSSLPLSPFLQPTLGTTSNTRIRFPDHTACCWETVRFSDYHPTIRTLGTHLFKRSDPNNHPYTLSIS